MFVFDHLAVSCARLQDGVDWVESMLGIQMGPGGQHPHFGTHNRLLSLGGQEYFEVIAIDPDASPPDFPRWFDIDSFSGPPRLTNWILACPNLDTALNVAGEGAGNPVHLSRGDYRWKMAVPPNGRLPMENVHPALIEWQSAHPAPKLPASGCRLEELVISHPDAKELETRLALTDRRLRFANGDPALQAKIMTPAGLRVLQ